MKPFDPNRYGPAGALDELVSRLQQIRGEILVGIDGRMAAGKTPLAQWLSEKLDWSLYSLDDSFKGDGSWHDHDSVSEALSRLKARNRPIIVEGARLLHTIDREQLGFLIFLDDEPACDPNGNDQRAVEQYLRDVSPRDLADFYLMSL